MEEDGFTLVKNHRKRRQQFAYPKKRNTNNKSPKKDRPDQSSPSVKDVDRVMVWAQKVMGGTDLAAWLHSHLQKIPHSQPLATIRAIGVGSFHSKSHFGAIQLALVLALRRHHYPQIRIQFQDPIIAKAEEEWLNSHDIEVLPTDDLLKSPGSTHEDPRATLCFMPHCEHFMYNNLLMSYWSIEGLKNLIIVGNNLRSLVESCPEKHLDEIPAIAHFSKISHSVQLPNYDEFLYAFSDTELMYLDPAIEELKLSFKDFVPNYSHFKPVNYM